MSRVDSIEASSLSRVVPLFVIDLDDVSVINKILCEISNPEDSSTFIFSKEGLRLVVNGDRTSQVSVFFSSRTFAVYEFNHDECIRYKFSLKDFIEDLNLLAAEEKSDDNQFPAKTSCQMFYTRKGDPLKLRLENNTLYSIDIDLREFSNPSVQTLMGFTEFEETAEITFFSKELYKYISGLDLASSVFVKIILESGDAPVRFQTESPLLGEVELEIRLHKSGDTNAEIIKNDLVLPNNRIFNFNYRCKFVAPAFEALKTSNYVRMKCGSTGLLLMEHFHGQDPNKFQSVEYFVLSEIIV